MRLFSTAIALGTAALLLTPDTSAQVRLSVANGEVQIQTGSSGVVRVARSASKSALGTEWTITDAQGFQYSVANYDAETEDSGGGSTGGGSTGGTGGGGTTGGGTSGGGSGGPIIAGGYDADTGGGGTGGGGTTGGGTSGGGSGGPIIAGGYDAAIHYLRTQYGATVRHDATLAVDHIDFPGQADPIGYFFQIVTRDSVAGQPLYMHFRLLEVPSRGIFEPTAVDRAKTNSSRFPFPNDDLYRLQWALSSSRLLLAQWHPAVARKAIRVGLVDSGVGAAQRSHPGLDGTALAYAPVAPTTGFPVSHGLNLATLFGDRSHDNSGIVGLLSSWGTSSCFPQPTLLARAQPSLTVYNVGDFGPDTYSVARALRAAAEAGIDVVNLSLHVAPSAIVEEAIRAAQKAGVIVVAAAGNYASNATDKSVRFPASMPGVISVGSVDISLHPASTSALTGVDIFAPGVDIVVGGSNGTWVYGSGTSYAAPHVVAAVALMRAANPDVTADEALDALQRYAIRRGQNGVPVLNALSSLNAVLDEDARVRLPGLAPGCSILDAFFGKDDAPIASMAYDGRIDDALFPAEDIPSATGLTGVYPNPARERATVAFDLNARQSVRVTLHDLLGREVARVADATFDAGAQRLDVDGSALPAGVYLIRVVTEAGTFSRPITFVR